MRDWRDLFVNSWFVEFSRNEQQWKLVYIDGKDVRHEVTDSNPEKLIEKWERILAKIKADCGE